MYRLSVVPACFSHVLSSVCFEADDQLIEMTLPLQQYITSHLGQLSLAIPPWVGAMSTSQRAVMLCGWGVKAGMVRMWVAGKTVWSHCYHGPHLSVLAVGSSHNTALYKCPITLILYSNDTINQQTWILHQLYHKTHNFSPAVGVTIATTLSTYLRKDDYYPLITKSIYFIVHCVTDSCLNIIHIHTKFWRCCETPLHT